MVQTPVWTLDDALFFVRALSFLLKEAGWGVGLHGSVLHRGSSYKDLDLILFPLSTEKADVAALKAALVRYGMTFEQDVDTVQRRWRSIGSADTKIVEVWSYGKKRVDIFLMK